jgi:hypothetical protein
MKKISVITVSKQLEYFALHKHNKGLVITPILELR